jgi:hypothetical protein
MQFKVIGSGRYAPVQSFTQLPEVLACWPLGHTLFIIFRQLIFSRHYELFFLSILKHGLQ